MAMAGNRRERERERHRGEILDAAEGVFAEKGFGGGTVEDVAVRAEFSVGTLYKFFASKEELYQALIETRWEAIAESMEGMLDAAAGPEGVVRAFGEGKARLCEKYLAFAVLYTRERMGDRFSRNSLWVDVVEPSYEKLLGRLAEAFAEGSRGGLYRTDQEARDMATALDGLTDAFMYEWLLAEERGDLVDKMARMTDLFLEGVRPR